jgi:hypothetical protein
MGYTEGNDLKPDISIAFNASDPVVTWNIGYAGSNYYDRVIYYISFLTGQGAQYGPYGTSTGTTFQYQGPFYGVWGLSHSYNRRLTTVGVWGMPPAPPQAPPLPIPPSPPDKTPNAPPPPLSPAANRVSVVYGWPGDWQSDDGKFFTGRTPFSSTCTAIFEMMPSVRACSCAMLTKTPRRWGGGGGEGERV